MEVYFGAANVVAPSDLDKWIEKVMDVMRLERNNYWVFVHPKDFTHSKVKKVVTNVIDNFKRARPSDTDWISCGGFKASCNCKGEIIIRYKDYRPYQTGIFR